MDRYKNNNDGRKSYDDHDNIRYRENSKIGMIYFPYIWGVDGFNHSSHFYHAKKKCFISASKTKSSLNENLKKLDLLLKWKVWLIFTNWINLYL